jgi:hypothetical protein
MKRLAEVPLPVARLGAQVSKADLLEAAYWLAAAVGESCDDENEALSNLLQELNVHRERRGAKPLKLTPLLTGKSMRALEGESEP